MKFELYQIIFLDFTGIVSLKYKQLMEIGTKRFDKHIDELSLTDHVR